MLLLVVVVVVAALPLVVGASVISVPGFVFTMESEYKNNIAFKNEQKLRLFKTAQHLHEKL